MRTICCILLHACCALAAPHTTLTIVHHFDGADGRLPQAQLACSEGWLYGTTPRGGKTGHGTAFRMRADGTEFQTLHHFTGTYQDGHTPRGPLIEDSTGTLFGATLAGGSFTQGGAVFGIEPDGTGFRVVRGFSRLGGEPHALGLGLALLDDNWLLGTSLAGGQKGKGTIFRVSKDGKELHVLHHFSGGPGDGLAPLAALTQTERNTFYGTTEGGGLHHAGTVYRLVVESP